MARRPIELELDEDQLALLDTDSDGIPDVYDADADADNDGIPDKEENAIRDAGNEGPVELEVIRAADSPGSRRGWRWHRRCIST